MEISFLKIGLRILVSLVLFSCSAQIEKHEPISFTYIGNMGVLIDNGQTQVLIDGLHLKYEPDYQCPPPELLDSIVFSKGRFHVDLIAFTHIHKDHFNEVPVLAFMEHNKQARLLAPQQIVDSLSLNPRFEKLKGRVYISNTTKKVELSKGVSVIPVSLMHTWPERHAKISNYSYTLVSGKTNIIHVGDAESNDQTFDASCFKHNTYDYAILPTWFMGKKSSLKTAQYIKAKQFIITHYNPLDSNKVWLEDNAKLVKLKAKVFSCTGEQIIH